MPIRMVTCTQFIITLALFLTLNHHLLVDASPLQDSSECFDTCACAPGEKIDLTFQSKSLTSIPHIDKGLDVRSLDFSHNSLAILRANNFEEYPNLEEIKVNHNRLIEIDDLTFHGLRELKRVYLENNLLQSFDKDIFETSVVLRDVSLSGNPLDLTPSSLLESHYITSLSLSNCKLSELFSENFVDLPILEVLDLSHNKLTSIPADIFQENVNLKTVYLQGNSFPCGTDFDKMLTYIKSITGNVTDINCINSEAAILVAKPANTETIPRPVLPKIVVNASIKKELSIELPREISTDVFLKYCNIALICILIVVFAGIFTAFWKDWIRFSRTQDPGKNTVAHSSSSQNLLKPEQCPKLYEP